ncbi:hypothetical protein TNIN_128531 [Trichonephila inaurata madagascariensis]|uniref:Uncharacterized protein n=1 Tax=Trichonephila inaurata madagascariensis TaxID=2747483 RepID=A0A8X6YH73_9ARAC|nr:hypothetical protein TNIN_128531 [Trichonephila inaurata madagascariensis]
MQAMMPTYGSLDIFEDFGRLSKFLSNYCNASKQHFEDVKVLKCGPKRRKNLLCHVRDLHQVSPDSNGTDFSKGRLSRYQTVSEDFILLYELHIKI